MKTLLTITLVLMTAGWSFGASRKTNNVPDKATAPESAAAAEAAQPARDEAKDEEVKEAAEPVEAEKADDEEEAVEKDEEAKADEVVNEEPADSVKAEKPSSRWKGERSWTDEGTTANEVLGGLILAIPTESGWDPGFGLELKVRHWWPNDWGVAAAIGYELFSYSESLSLTPTVVTPIKAEGDVTVMPVSLLAARRLDLKSSRQAVFEGGIRYLFLDSDLEVSSSYVDHFGRNVEYSTFTDNEGQVMFLLGAELRGEFRKELFWLAAAEYQFYLGDPDPNWLGEDVANDFSALLLRVGVGRTW